MSILSLSFLKTLIVCVCLSWAAGARMSPAEVQMAVGLIFAAALGAGLVIVYGEYQRLMSPASQWAAA